MNDLGEAGVHPDDTTPSWLPKPVAGGHVFTKLAFGHAHTCGITTSGAAYCWGASGLLGNGAGGSPTTPVPVPVPVSGGHTFVDIGATFFGTCGLTDSGEIYCWGDNYNGAFGNLWMENVPHPVRVGGDQTFRAIGVGWEGDVCAIRTDDQLVCWGGPL